MSTGWRLPSLCWSALGSTGVFSRVRLGTLALLVATIGTLGCQERLYQFGVEVIPQDGGSVDLPHPAGGTGGGGTGGSQGGTGGYAGTGSYAGTGGGGTGGGGTGGGGTGGGVITCSDTSPDRQTDLLN